MDTKVNTKKRVVTIGAFVLLAALATAVLGFFLKGNFRGRIETFRPY